MFDVLPGICLYGCIQYKEDWVAKFFSKSHSAMNMNNSIIINTAAGLRICFAEFV